MLRYIVHTYLISPLKKYYFTKKLKKTTFIIVFWIFILFIVFSKLAKSYKNSEFAYSYLKQ